MKEEHKAMYEEYYGKQQTEDVKEDISLNEFHKKILKLLGDKGNTSDKISEKLKVRENDVRRALNEMLIENKVTYKKTVKRGKLAYIWKEKRLEE